MERGISARALRATLLFVAAGTFAFASPAGAQAADPVIAAAGDIACDPDSPSFNGGLGTSSACRQKFTADLLRPGLAAVLALGDLQYEQGVYEKFLRSYDPSWGIAKAKTRPVPGNHEYQTAGAAGYFRYFGETAGDPRKGYYSYDLGSWHVVALNSNCAYVPCAAGSEQERWLRADLAASRTSCTLAYWHHPRFSSGTHGSDPATDAFWRALYEHGADVVVNGHDHDYERFAPQTPAGLPDAATGIREFVVGTGGKSLRSFGTPLANSEVRHAATYGVLELTLRPQSYDWRFVAEGGGSFSDSGTAACNRLVDTTPPSAPRDLRASATAPTTVDLAWLAATDDSGVTGYEIFRNGLPFAATGTTPAYSDATVVPGVSYEYSVRARDAAGNRSASSNAVVVTTPIRPLPPGAPSRPAVTAVSPAVRATGVRPTGSVSVTFTRAMDRASTEAAFSLVRAGAAHPVRGTFSWTANTMRFRPASALAHASAYTATVAAGARDAAGTELAAAYSWTFTTSRRVTLSPRRAVIVSGSARRGGVGSLKRDDGAFYEVESTPTGRRTTAWYGEFTRIPPSLFRLEVRYRGKNSRACRQGLALWRWQARTWTRIDARRVGGRERSAFAVRRRALAAYVGGEAARGRLRVLVRCTNAAARFRARTDELKVVYEAP